MNMIFEPVTDKEQAGADTQPKCTPRATDFLEGRPRLIFQYLNCAIVEPPVRTVKTNNRRNHTSEATAAVAEESLYWLISAPTLVYLVYLIVGL